ncbi:MAG TPA: class I SAM-dependent methyltransferase [Polyangiaceae bacterium]|nr:class I SAM-dependent methyltransferase [Polyangiaceae bacterium]
MRHFVDFEMALLERSMHEAAPYASGALLDVGCGDKPYEAIFAPHVNRYVGAEYEDTYSSSANASKHKANVLYSGDRLPFENDEFDTVLCNQVAEHVPDPDALFRELVRVLRPGGRLIFTVPFSYRIHSEPTDFHRFTRYALTNYSDRHGLQVDLLKPRGGFWTVIGQKLTSHMALKYARLRREIQALGGMGYEAPEEKGPRYWALPIVAPAILAVAAATRLLEKLEPDDSDTIGYLLIATKRRP